MDRIGRIARAAGDAIMAHYTHGDGRIDWKADNSPVTSADRASHDVIRDALVDWDPTVPIVSEEGEVCGYDERRCWNRFWLVDPLDGTKEFIQRNGEFTVNIALVEDGEPVMGVVYAPAIDRLYCAARGLGAWKSDGEQRPARIFSQGRPPGEALVIVESRSHPSAELEAYLAGVVVERRIQVGSSLKFCCVAEGSAHLYPRFGPTMEWDTAAGDCVFRQSGRHGSRTSPLRYNTPSLRNESFVIGL